VPSQKLVELRLLGQEVFQGSAEEAEPEHRPLGAGLLGLGFDVLEERETILLSLPHVSTNGGSAAARLTDVANDGQSEQILEAVEQIVEPPSIPNQGLKDWREVV
jgi:hypothetical protein